jgi:L-gulonolactone oxidase
MTWWKSADDEWWNYLGEQRFLPQQRRKPGSEDKVAKIVSDAVSAGVRVHFAGAGHASSSLVPCDGWLLEGDHLQGATREEGNCVRVLAGTRIARLNAELDAMGLAMPNLGSATFQSITGAIATGTHGSGVKYGPLCDSVRSVDIVDGRGTRLRVEPKSAPYSKSAPIQLVHDDDMFHSVVVGIGVCGLVTSLVIEARPAFLLSETRTLTTWEALLADEELDATILAADHYEIWLNPYVTEGHSAIVTVRSEVPSGTPLRPRVDPWELQVPFIRKLLTWGLDTFPQLVPGALAWAMRSQQTKDGPWVDHSQKIFDLGSINDMPALATEWFFPFAKWRDAVETMLAEARKLSLRPRAIGGVPFGVRFVKASPHFLAMTYGKDDELFCSIELPVYDDEHDRNTLLRGYERAAEKHGGRPHWGQAHHPRRHKHRHRYPRFDDWKKIRDALDPNEAFANLSSYREGFTDTRMLHPVIAHELDTFDPKNPMREVLEIDPSRAVHVDRRRFDVHASAAKFVEAFQRALLEPGALVAHKFEVLRQADRVGELFAVGERFQGRFAIDKQLVEDASPHPACWTKILRAVHVDKILQLFEDKTMSNYGEVTELSLPRRIQYVYLTGTPFAGNSLFTVEAIDDDHCRYTEQITFQPTNEQNALAMELIGLKLHNQVVFGQVEAACDLLHCHHTPLDPLATGKPNVK